MGGYCIGIDGGSTKTAAVMLDATGQPVARAVGGPANYHMVGLDETEANVFDVIGQLLADRHISIDDIRRFCLALSGVWRHADHRAISRMLGKHGILDRSMLVSDIEVLFAGTGGEGPVVVVIAGTGSVVLGRDETGRRHKVGGNGHLLDDDGSGYDIGRAGLRAVLEASDGRGPATRLTETLPAAAGLAEVAGIVPWLYGASAHKQMVAALAPVVLDAAADGDAMARGIVGRAANHLARWTDVAASALRITDGALTVVLAGGVLEHSEVYRRLVADRILEELAHAKVVMPEHEAAYCAARIALTADESARG